MVAIEFKDGGAAWRMARLTERVRRPVTLARVGGRAAQQVLRSHYRNKDRTEPNKLGGKRTHFWRSVMASVQNPKMAADGSQVVVSINHPAIRQKVQGGTIVPKRAKALTIPVSPEAHGRTASTFERETGLQLFLIKVGKGALQEALLASRRGGGFQVEYVLKSSVRQDPDPTALPARSVVEAAVLRAMESAADREARDTTGGAS